MAKNLVIVESPAKSKTISKFLGKDYKVMASMGHVRDLPKSDMGIDMENGFKPRYGVSPDKKEVIRKLKAEVKSGTTVWIATDEDREGEAIGWHLTEALKIDPKKNPTHRIVFHEITKTAIQKAVENPRELNQDLVNAQQARRVLDRLVGYELSPLLWKKVRYGLSAGRVQSVAVRLVVEREREIRNFKPEEFWKIKAVTETNKKKEITFDLFKIKGKPAKVHNEKEAKTITDVLEKEEFVVSSIEKKKSKKYPAPPFITSTLQQEAARKLGFSVKKTMMVAQQLYEGSAMGSDHGLITYMRTDSFNLAGEALKAIKKHIEKEYGEKYAIEKPRTFKGKKGAQEAHEAIRPTHFNLSPKELKSKLTKDQLRLYELIWKRTLACQMAEAQLDQTAVDIEVKDYLLRATGQVIVFDGFMKVYIEGKDKKSDDDEEGAKKKGDKILPPVEEGDALKKKEILKSQHFTKPPARYTEASLVKKLEAEGIGRPSTYAPTISTVMNRGYIEKDGRALKPTDTAEVVTDILVEHFTDIVDYGFTREMEDDLDNIAIGKIEWQPLLKEFYEPFHKNIEEKMETIKKGETIKDKTDEKCDECKKPMQVKLGRFGKFLSCTDYPTCKFAKPLPGQEKPEKNEKVKELEKKLSGKKCSKCKSDMVVKTGRYGEFLACSGYPKCKNIESIVKPTGVNCPNCKDGQIVEKHSRKGKLFYGCNKFPKCKTAYWDKPINKKCPECEEMLTEKYNKSGTIIKCSGCEYKKESDKK